MVVRAPWVLRSEQPEWIPQKRNIWGLWPEPQAADAKHLGIWTRAPGGWGGVWALWALGGEQTEWIPQKPSIWKLGPEPQAVEVGPRLHGY